MAYDFKAMRTDEILKKINFQRRVRYADVYEKILTLRAGEGFEIDLESQKDAVNMRNTISGQLKKKGLGDKYIASNRGSKFYCGRIK